MANEYAPRSGTTRMLPSGDIEQWDGSSWQVIKVARRRARPPTKNRRNKLEHAWHAPNGLMYGTLQAAIRAGWHQDDLRFGPYSDE